MCNDFKGGLNIRIFLKKKRKLGKSMSMKFHGMFTICKKIFDQTNSFWF